MSFEEPVSVARVRGAQQICCNSNFEEGRLNSFFLVVEDWHTKVCFMEVSYSNIKCGNWM